MPTRYRKTRKHRGSRTCGWGQIGQHRKTGAKGGHGNAGLHKHGWTWVLKYKRDYFGKHGFHRPNKREVRTVNLFQLSVIAENLMERGELREAEGIPLLNLKALGIEKVVAGGKLGRPLLVVAEKWTEKAEEKIKKAGGKIIKPEELKV